MSITVVTGGRSVGECGALEYTSLFTLHVLAHVIDNTAKFELCRLKCRGDTVWCT